MDLNLKCPNSYCIMANAAIKKVTKLVKHVKVPSFHTICGPNVSVACAGQRLEIGHKYFAIWTLACCKITLP